MYIYDLAVEFLIRNNFFNEREYMLELNWN